MGSIPFKPPDNMSGYKFMDGLILRTPAFSFARYAAERLAAVLGDPDFRRALLLASPGFYALVQRNGFELERLDGKQRFTLLKYYNRMCFRPTPFGGFASFTKLEWGTGQVRLAPLSEGILFMEAEAVPDPTPVIAEYSVLKLSPLLYQMAGEYRFIKRCPAANGRDKYTFTLEALPVDPMTNRLFALLGKGPRRPGELVSFIIELTGCGAEEAFDHLQFLGAQQLIYDSAKAAPLIRGEKCQQAPDVPIAAPDLYAALKRPGIGGPSAADRAGLEKAVAALQRLSVAGKQTELEQFRQAFSARFGEQKVPLLIATDPDAGIAYGAGAGGQEAQWTSVHRLFMKRWLQDNARGAFAELELSETDLAGHPPAIFPPTTTVLFRKTGGRLLIEHAGGPTATALAGRFSFFCDDTLQLCREIAEAEAAANPGVVFADITLASGTHVDNINLRRRIYPYEVALDGNTIAEREQVLSPDDLLLSVRGNELILESVRLQKRVIPRLATAFNHRHNGLGVFRLLGDLQSQGLQTALSLQLDLLFPGLPFYPRVMFGRCILSPARWVFSKTDLPECYEDFDDFRRRYHLPQKVSSGNGDQQLVFDLGEEQEAAFFLQYIRGLEQVILTEYPSPGRHVLDGRREMAGQYLAFLRQEEVVYPPSVGKVIALPDQERRFAPGSKWLYLKLYCAEASSGRVLTELIAPFLKASKGMVSGFFFVRYHDPEPHIRLRLSVKGGAAGSLLNLLEERCKRVPAGMLVRALIADTYVQELERYGPDMMVFAEAVFCAGSELSLALLRAMPAPEMEPAILTVWKMLPAFLPRPADQLDFAERSSEAFAKEFNLTKADRLELDIRYRALRPGLAAWANKPLQRVKMKALFSELTSAAALAAGWPAEKSLRLLSDLCHMQLNRSFASDQRRNEMEVWYYLHKYLKGEQGKIRQASLPRLALF